MSDTRPDYYKVREFECIDEMMLVFGKEAVLNFCLLNAWEYRYRAGFEALDEDEIPF